MENYEWRVVSLNPYEYNSRIDKHGEEIIEDYLNEMDNKDWELVSMVREYGQPFLITHRRNKSICNGIIEHNVKAFVQLDKNHMDIVEEILGDYGFEECEYEHIPDEILGDFVYHGEYDDHWYSYGDILVLLENGSMTHIYEAQLHRVFNVILENDKYYKKHNIK